ncbi:MAG TPA: hypothetical protein VJM34_06920 [Novosphingobium sp.]|nr:hypothetical protein [Novosphingobium sp.]
MSALDRGSDRDPRFETGWMPSTDPGRGHRFVAFLRPYSEDWYDLYQFPTWWAAQAYALSIADRVPDCAYVGRPDFEEGARA